MIAQQDIQELLALEVDEGYVTSLYLNVDTAQQPAETIKMQARALLKEADANEDDAKAIENYLDLAYEWDKPGLAIFSCDEISFFRAFPANVAFRNRIRLRKKPYVKPLTHLLDNYAHYGVVVLDKIGARFYEYHQGELQELAGTMGEDVRKLKVGGGSSRGGAAGAGQRGGQGGRHEEEVVQRNLREAATLAGQFFANKPIRRLFLGGTSENVAQFKEHLSKQLQSCLAGTFPIDMNAGEHEVRKRSLELLEAANSQREEELVKTMVTLAAKGGNAVVGLPATLKTVSEGRVQTLIISDGYKMGGFLDESSHYLSAHERDLEQPAAGSLTRVEDVIELAVSRTMSLGGIVEIIADNPDLEKAGQIGALLRY